MNEKSKELIEKLESRLATINKEELTALLESNYKNYHNYSLNNIILAYSQLFPEEEELDLPKLNQMQLAPFKVWSKDWGLKIKKGSKSLKVIFPKLVKAKDRETGKPRLNEEGEEEKYLSFGVGSIFDVSQVEGKTEDRISRKIEGTATLSKPEIETRIKNAGYSITFEPQNLNKGGHIKGKEITINSLCTESAQFATLLHELAHGELGHAKDDSPRSTKEVEAESVAFVVGQYLGIDIPSEFYVGSWQNDGKEIRKSLSKIDRAVTSSMKILGIN
jgi:hypothetical protein